MKQFLIKYRRTNGSTEDWHREIGTFIAAIDSDPALKGKVGYRCLKARDGEDYFHIATVHDDSGRVALQERADAQRLDELVATADVVVDCCDNFTTRHAVNAACVKHGKPLVSGAAIGFDGQISVYDTRQATAPCYACIFPPDAAFEEVRCATMGVLAPLVGIIGSMQAAEALKLLAGTGSSLAGRLQMLDARSMEWTEIRTPRNADCSVCGTRNS
jgi:molybdopterin/thiamine biosynthesis adenylyltransferase